MKIHTKTFEIAGRLFSFEIGELAPRAESAVYARYGDTVVLAVVSVSKEDSDRGYFPLSVEYQEKLYAGGRIKGSRWVKREGRPSDDLVLKARLIDRSIRPLFPKTFKKDVQIIVTVLSVDRENDPDMVGMLAVSAALSISSIPWNGPIGAVRVGTAHDDFVINPTNAEMEYSDLDLVVAGTKEKVMMIEAGAHEVPEEKVLSAIKIAQEQNVLIVKEIEKLAEKIGKKKQKVPKSHIDVLVKAIKKSHEKKIIKILTDSVNRIEGSYEKKTALIDTLEALYKETYTRSEIQEAIDYIFAQHIRNTVLNKNIRVDGRGIKDFRPIKGKVSVLPRTHGSALFQRGDTQALTITTLAPPSLEQWLESAEGEETKRYMHHYNMPPFSVGETGRVGWPSRREIGHGALAERALEPVIPNEKDFPYTIHVVSEILSSNGSTSMASVCGSTLSLMDAGVPIKAPVAGISTGLIAKSDTEYVLLTDIQGVEDFTGDMDFKIAGTKKGITAIQLDIKINGLTMDIIQKTFSQSREARMKILDIMHKVLPETRSKISQYAPKVEALTIPQDKIGEVIGPGGRVIKSIIADTSCDVNVDDDGVVTVSGQTEEKVKEAIDWIKGIIREVHVGEVFEGTIKRIMSFGAFVEILPGKEGLVHLSKMSREYVEKPEDVVQVGDKVKVRVIEIDAQKRINLSMLFDDESGGERSSHMYPSGRDYRKKKSYNRKNTRFHRSYRHPHLRSDD